MVVGSWGGASVDPSWAGNLRADAAATVRVGRKADAVRAREIQIEDPERDRLWRLVCAAFPLYAAYQRKTTRLIPLFVLGTSPALS